MRKLPPPQTPLYKRRSLGTILRKYWFIYLLVQPGFIFVALFSYGPMYGILLAFKDYNYGKGILGSDWAGFKYFQQMFSDSYFWKVVWNTVVINLYNIVVGFTFTIFFALMLNEMKLRRTKRLAQTAVYLPLLSVMGGFCRSDSCVSGSTDRIDQHNHHQYGWPRGYVLNR